MHTQLMIYGLPPVSVLCPYITLGVRLQTAPRITAEYISVSTCESKNMAGVCDSPYYLARL